MATPFNDVIHAFVAVCDLVSDSVDMIQAGGGNASAKFEKDGQVMMLIKASGFLMSEVDAEKGYTQIQLDKVQNILLDVNAGNLSIDDDVAINLRIAEANIGKFRPSIETFLHAIMTQKYILHVHALTTLVYASSIKFLDDMANQWTVNALGIKTLYVPYEKPGIHLAMAMLNGIDQYKIINGVEPDIIILQNHGLIVASEDPDKLLSLISEIEVAIKAHMDLPKSFGKVYSDQRLIKKAINDVVKKTRIFVRANEDRDLINYREGMPSFPDALVFCGLEPLVIQTVTEENTRESFNLVIDGVKQYVEKYGDYPKVIQLNAHLFFCGESIKKCLEVQDVLKIQGILRRELGDTLVTLTQEQAYTLLNWEAESYRKNL